MEADPEALIAALEEAETPDEILAAVAAVEWFNQHDGEAIPTEALPTEAAFTEWIQSVSEHRAPPPPGTIRMLHLTWRRTKRPGVHHPLASLALAFLQRPVAVDIEAKPNAILPKSLFDWAGEGAPAIVTHSRHDNELPLRPGATDAKADIPFLPGVEPKATEIVPSPALALVDEAGFGRVTPGAGARMDKRLLVLSLMSMPLSERRPGGRYTLRPTLRTLVHDWLMPPPKETGTGRDKRSGWRPARHADPLKRAMNAVTLAGVILPDGCEWRPVMFRKLPDFANLDSRATIEIALPDFADRGPLMDRKGLIAAGVVSDMAFDGALTLATLWDRAKAMNGGKRIYATRPKALRDKNGVLTRANGSPITGAARNPVTGTDGKPKWLPGDTPQRDWRHPEAVISGTERQPQVDKIPVLSRDDRRRLFYGQATDAQSKRMRSHYASQADARLRTLEAQGRIIIENCGRDGWRILEPAPTPQTGKP